MNKALSIRPEVTTFASHNILVAGDNAAVREVIAHILRRHGFAVIDADGGERGVAAVAACCGALDLAIIDMQMPGVSGLDLAVEVERTYPGIKVLFISGNRNSIALDCIVRSSRDAVLFKPFTVPSLLGRVSRLLELDD